MAQALTPSTTDAPNPRVTGTDDPVGDFLVMLVSPLVVAGYYALVTLRRIVCRPAV